MPTAQALATILGSATPDDFRCVVADLERSNADQMALRALEQSTAALSGAPATLYLTPGPTASSTFPSFNFVAGASETGSIVVLCWEPSPSKRLQNYVATQWATDIAPAVAHEDLEVTRYADIGFTTAYATVLANMVTDGIADSFATAQTHISQPWDNTFASPQQEQQIWSQIQPDLASGDSATRSAIMFGGGSQHFPPDTGYTIGFHIVQGYLARHPAVTFAQLAGLATATIYDGSGYTG
jgi:hypothetical protein